ncbi:cysteine dioxygenase family protein [Haloechinothrix sp. YIM 98757]|uniref:Cysteine dioxygenase family protein n=1 Tax=Haloechinothrix aidingensis TaxID=2752311 RepID=A0A838A732_9PSEU|nr:cysteine dioxygenase family protein [Haloechinothrix aidingensis]
MFAVPDNTVVEPGSGSAPRHPVRVAMDFAAERERWRDLLRYDPSERFAVLVESGTDQEVWLMSWLPGQGTDIHDHGDTSGAFTVVNGQLTEVVARRRLTDELDADGVDTHVLDTGQSRVFGPGYAHRMRNDGPDPAVSIHVYRYGSRTVRSLRD